MPTATLETPPPPPSITAPLPSPKRLAVEPLKGQALLDVWADFIGCFEGPGDLSARHSEYFAEALIEKFERKKQRNA